MDEKKKQAIMNSTTFDELLDAEYGKIGTPGRDKYEDEAHLLSLQNA